MKIANATSTSRGRTLRPISRRLLLAICLTASAAQAQEFRATISGRVTDTSGALVPHAAVTIRNVETGVSVDTTSSDAGEFTVPFLLPGKYSIKVSSAGFQGYIHDGLNIQAGEKIQEDIALKTGAATEEIRVTADTALIQTASATTGQVLTPEEIENLPDNGRSPLALAKTEFGVVPKMKYSVVQARPFDNSAQSDFSVGGGASQTNQYLLNGVPNLQTSSRLPGFSPYQDSVAEVRVDVFQSDAAYGDSSSGAVNIITKAGTNSYHGNLSEFNQFSAIDAPFRWFTSPTVKQYASRQNQYGGTIGGPVRIPKVFNGHDKLFFFYAYEGFRGTTPTVGLTTVPTAAERQGDFSALLALGSKYQLYNPFTATQSGSSVVRTAIPNNCLTGQSAYCSSVPNAGLTLNTVALAYLPYFPAANLAGNSDGTLNYSYSYNTINNYSSNQGRLDANINDSNKIFFETHRSAYTQTTGNIFPNISTGAVSFAVHQGGVLDYIHTFSPRYTLDTRMGLTRTYLNSTIASNNFDATSLGLPGYLDQPSSPHTLPVVTFSDSYQALSAGPGANTTFGIIQLFSALTAVQGSHTVKVGIDFQNTKLNTINAGGTNTSGSFTFGDNFVNAGTGAANPTNGGSLASFLLGLPTSGSFGINPRTTFNTWYFSGFLQDDWRATHNLTINAGIRFESESSVNESNNRALWFDPTLTNSVAAPAATAYAANPIPELPAASFSAPGGFQFAGTNGRRVEYFTQPVYVSPRVGLAYTPNALHGKLAIHAGYGLYFGPLNDLFTPQTYGFASSTSYVPTTNNYLTSATTLSNPFPTTNPIAQPVGSAAGVNTFLGQAITIRPKTVKGPYAERYNLDLQYAISPNSMFEVAYIGAMSYHQIVNALTTAVSSTPLLPYLSRLPYRDTALETNLTSSVANPFKGLAGETGTLGTASTIQKQQLLQAYPQYASVGEQFLQGQTISFNELAVRFQKRTSHGLTMNINYQYSKLLLTQPLNPGGPLSYQEDTFDFPQHIALTGSYALPIGAGHALLGHSNHIVTSLAGGWTVNSIYTYLLGACIGWGGPGGAGQPYFTNGTAWDPRLKVRPRNITNAVDQSLIYQGSTQGSATYTPSTVQPTNFNYRTFPLFFGRQDAANNLDASILKDFTLGEHVRLQYRFEAYNVLNHTQFGAPTVTPSSANFGKITSQANIPRVLQQGLRVVF